MSLWLWMHDIRCKYMFMFRLTNLACKGLNLKCLLIFSKCLMICSKSSDILFDDLKNFSWTLHMWEVLHSGQLWLFVTWSNAIIFLSINEEYDTIYWWEVSVLIKCLVAWWHQAITWTNVDFSSVQSSDIHLRAISQTSNLTINHENWLKKLLI